MLTNMETFYTPEEISKRLKVHLQTVLNYIKDGRLKAVKLDKGYRISEMDFKRFVERSQVVKTPEDYLLQMGYHKKYKAFRKTSMRPSIPLANLIPNKDLGGLLEKASVENKHGYRAFPFPSLSLMAENEQRWPDGILLEKEVTFAGDMLFFAFVSNRGEILTAESLWEDTESSNFPNSIGLITSVGIIYRGLLFIPRYYSAIKYTDKVNYAFIIDKPAGRSLVMDSERGRIWRSGYVATTEDPIIIEKTVDVSISADQTAKIAIEMVKDLIWYFKCDLNDEMIKSLVEEAAQNISK